MNFRPKVKEYYVTKEMFLIVFDITNRESFDNVENWFDEIRDMKDGSEADNRVEHKNSVYFIVGNKYDLDHERKVE